MHQIENPWIAEVCDHYPDAFAIGAPAGKKTCHCADCFYCDNNDLSDEEQ